MHIAGFDSVDLAIILHGIIALCTVPTCIIIKQTLGASYYRTGAYGTRVLLRSCFTLGLLNLLSIIILLS